MIQRVPSRALSGTAMPLAPTATSPASALPTIAWSVLSAVESTGASRAPSQTGDIAVSNRVVTRRVGVNDRACAVEQEHGGGKPIERRSASGGRFDRLEIDGLADVHRPAEVRRQRPHPPVAVSLSAGPRRSWRINGRGGEAHGGLVEHRLDGIDIALRGGPLLVDPRRAILFERDEIRECRDLSTRSGSWRA